MTPEEARQHMRESNTKWIPPTTLMEAVSPETWRPLPGGGQFRVYGGKIEVNRTSAQLQQLEESIEDLNEVEQEPKSRVKDDAPDSILAYARRVAAERGPRQQQETKGTVKDLREVKDSDYRILGEALTESGTFRPAPIKAREIGTTDAHMKLYNALR